MGMGIDDKPKFETKKASDTELALTLVNHINKPCEDLEGNNIRSFYIREAIRALPTISNEDAKMALEKAIQTGFQEEIRELVAERGTPEANLSKLHMIELTDVRPTDLTLADALMWYRVKSGDSIPKSDFDAYIQDIGDSNNRSRQNFLAVVINIRQTSNQVWSPKEE